MWVYGLDWAGPGQGQLADACECGNEPSGSVKCGEFLDQLQTSQLLKNDSVPWSKYENQSVNAQQENNRCCSERNDDTVWASRRILMWNLVVT